MPRVKSDKITIWGAVREGDGKILISSISAYYSVAKRWALRYRHHSVMKIAVVDRVMTEEYSEDEYKFQHHFVEIPVPPHRPPESESDVVEEDDGEEVNEILEGMPHRVRLPRKPRVRRPRKHAT